jgi:hypothetical protein
MFTGIGMLVLEAGLDKFFNRPAVWESLEVAVVLSSLGDISKHGKGKQITTYHHNDVGNDQLWLVVLCNGEVKPSHSS